MYSIRKIGMMAMVLIMAWAPAAPALDLAGIETKIGEVWAQHHFLSADLRIDAEIMGVAVTGSGTLSVIIEGGAAKYTQHFVLELPEPLSVQAIMDVLYDGQNVYLVREMLGEKEAFKLDPSLSESAPPPGGPLLFNLLKKDHNLEALEDAVVHKRPAYVVRCTPREGAAPDSQPTTVFFDKETGLALKIEIQPKEGAKPVVIACENIDPARELNPASFVFTLADGTQLVDRSQAPAAPANEPAAAETPPADAPPAGAEPAAPPAQGQ